MLARLADAVVLLHVLFVAFAIAGGLLAFRWRWMPWLHLPALVWAATVEFAGWTCPLTPLENALRRAGGGAIYPSGFIEHYLLPILYPAGLTRDTQWMLGIALVLVNMAIYAALVWRARRTRATLAAQGDLR